MGKEKDTPSAGQQRAMEAGGHHLLVSAAAGSGKTYTLVERIVANILAKKYRIDELLVVTFTNAAATEMRERIEKKLMAEVAAHPEAAHQLILLPTASISTLHAFCQRLIREHFTTLDIDPKFRLANEQEMALMRQAIVREVFEAEYERQEEGFLKFVESYGSDRGDEQLYEMVLALYDFSESQPDPAAWLSRLAAPFRLPEHSSMEQTLWYPVIMRQIERTLAACKDAASYFAEEADRDGLPGFATAFADDEQRIVRLIRAAETGDWERMREEFTAPTKVLQLKNTTGAELDKVRSDFYRNGRNKRIKETLADLCESYFTEEAGALMEDLRASEAEASALCELVRSFAEAFSAAKKKKAVLDFNDLEHYAIDILSQPGVAETLKRRYKEIMVDEYQDTNGVQEAILQKITNGRNLFMVGDVKQSIYRFRLADPTLFIKKQDRYGKTSGEGECIELNENYRSRPEVLAAANFLFSQLMASPEMELRYDEKAALYPKADFPQAEGKSFAGEAAELLLIESGAAAKSEDETERAQGFAAEAEIIARKLREMKDTGVLVYDKDERSYRRFRWRDAAVLMRAVKEKAQTLLETLRVYDIPAYADIDAGYFQEKEVNLVLDLLSVIDNAHQDIPLAAVLRSMIGGMTTEELATLRVDAERKADFFAALAEVAEKDAGSKAAQFLARLEKWRSFSRRVGVPELLWQLYRDTGYYDYVGAQPGGLVRQANLRMLVDRAADYEKTSFRGLFRFLKFIRQMRERDTDLSVARTLGEKEDVVRIMTVHKSKGLEFPVVILADMAKEFNLRDGQENLLIHRELGLGMFCTKKEGTLVWRYPTVARRAVQERILQEAKAEEMRILYVALTRAREKLILVGRVKSVEKCAKDWCRYASSAKTALPGHAVLGAKSWLDWIGMAVARSEAGAVLRETAGVGAPVCMEYDEATMGTANFAVHIVEPPHPAEETPQATDDEWMERIRNLQPLPVREVEEHTAALSWQYSYRTDITAKMTVTEIKRRADETSERAAYPPALSPLTEEELQRKFPLPEFLAPAETPKGGAAFGTIAHEVMQNLCLAGPLDEEDIKKQLDGFLADGVLTEEERNAVEVRSIARFFASPLGCRMKAAREKCWREQSFSLLLPASEIVGDASSQDEIFLQGVIDVFFEDADSRIVLVDYKTDRNTTPEIIRKRYRAQLDLYARAIREITGRAVDESYIYRLSDGDTVAIGNTE